MLAIKDSSNAFFLVAALGFVAALILRRYGSLGDWIFPVTGAWCVRRFQSRIAAVSLLVFVLGEAGATVAHRLGAPVSGGDNLIISAIGVWAAIRAVQATFTLCRLARSDDRDAQPCASDGSGGFTQ